MTAASQEVVTMFETCGLTLEQIVKDTGYDITTVKSILTQYSAAFRQDSKTDVSLQYSEDEAQEAKEVILNVMRYAETVDGQEDARLKFKAACRIIDENKGRLDVAKQVQGLNINIIQFNEQLEKVRQAKERTLSRVHDIETAKKQLVNA